MQLQRFTVANISRCEEMFHHIEEWSLTDWATAMAGECGEACNLIKKIRRGDNIDRRDVGHEIADLVTYADLLCTALGLNLGELLVEKFNIVSKRVGSTVFLRPDGTPVSWPLNDAPRSA